MVGSIIIVGALTRSALIRTVCHKKVAQINVQRCLIRERLLYEFKLADKAVEATRKICWEESWKHSWSQYSNLMVQEISQNLQELRQSDKVRLT